MHEDVQGNNVQLNSKNAIQENHPNPLYHGIGTFTKRKICGIYFYFILFKFNCNVSNITNISLSQVMLLLIK